MHMKQYNTTEEALRAYKAHLRHVTLKDITSWTTLTEQQVWKDLNDLAERGRLISTVLGTEDMAMRIEFFDR